MANNSALIINLFKPTDTAGSYRFDFYMKGNIYPVEIDDKVPMYTELGKTIMLMAEGVNNTMWGPLLEKAYSELVGNYLSIATGGVSIETVRAFLGFPGFMFNSNQTQNTTGNVWEMIRDGLKRKDIVTASTPTVKATQQSVLN